MTTLITLGYWKIQGLIEPIRQQCEYLDIPYEMIEYDGPEGLNQFNNVDAPALKTPFFNLPYLKDGDTHIAQSRAIVLHLAHKAGKYHELFGATPEEEVKIEELAGHVKDLYSTITTLCYNQDFENAKEGVINGRIVPKLKMLSKYYQGKKFLHGDHLVYADFWIYPVLNILFKIDESQKTAFPEFVQYMENYKNVPAIKNYFENNFVQRPINNPIHAKFF